MAAFSYRNPTQFLEFFVVIFLFSCRGLCMETNTITRGMVIQETETIISSGRIYKLGFFSPSNSSNRYMGIWNDVSQDSVIWVANRNRPVHDPAGSITISEDGNLVVLSSRKEILWSSNLTNPSKNSTFQLLDSGNLVLRDDLNGTVLWESFKHPSDAFVPTMKITDNLQTGEKVVLTAWKSLDNPDYGDFVAGLDASRIPQIFIWNGSRPHWRSGPWNGLILTGVTDMYAVYLDGYSLTRENDGTVAFTRDYYGHILMKIILKPNGSFVQTMWDDTNKNWNVTWVAPIDACDVYGTCGPYGTCNMRRSPICGCLKGYEPARKEEWERGDWSGGCERRRALQCERGGDNGDRFSLVKNVKVPDFIEVLQGRRDECESFCLSNCSCVAYSHDAGIGCMFWSGSLIDVREYPSGGSDLYVRVAYSVLDDEKDLKVIIIASVMAGLAAISICILGAWLWRKKGEGTKRKRKQAYPSDDIEDVSLDELPLYTFETIANATNHFDATNLLGKGGFGPVYKGTLKNGEEIAVKRLSTESGQGLQEFMNEVVVISKLQHRNLVSLLGCSVEKEEKMLVYEFMVNGSLDMLLFDPDQEILDWEKRFNIMQGIGRGLLYLHRDSRLRIIHRDLKPSNVLLDENWNPKISDFGMARIFGGREAQANTARVVGTYGYMAPEYAMGGRFSEKSDVFSFGVLMLEILTGRRNSSFYNDDTSLSLLEYVWRLWNDGDFEGLIDKRISSPRVKAEIIRCINIGLLCVQEFPIKRPAISTVLSMLGNEIADLPTPEQPAYTKNPTRNHPPSSSSDSHTSGSLNSVTITVLEGR